MINIPHTRKPIRQIGIIPLIDVAMFLLIFFMVAGSIDKFEIIPINPPKAESGALVDEGHIIILLGAHEEVVLQDELVTIDELLEKVREMIAENPAKVVTIKADGSIPANSMLTVMDALKKAGVTNLSIATERKQGNANAQP